MRLAMHVITQNHQDKMLRLLDATQGYFDVIRVCDGGSTDFTVGICKMYGCKVTEIPFKDDMSIQHNALLKMSKKGEMVFVMDDDEIPSPQLLDKLREYAEDSDCGRDYRLVKIPSIMLISGVADWNTNDLINAILAGEQEDRFTKMNLFYNDGEVYYEGASHYGLAWEHIKNWETRGMVPEPYFHYKEPIDIVRCNIQQAYINPTMQGMTARDGVEWQRMLFEEFSWVLNLNSHGMLRILEEGLATNEMKQWMVARRHPSLGSVSDFFEYYFLYHNPGQLVEFLDYDNIDLKYDAAVIRHLKDLGGYRSYTVDASYTDRCEHWLPIAHLGLHPELWKMLDTNQILIKEETPYGDSYDLDPFAGGDNEDAAIEGCFPDPELEADDSQTKGYKTPEEQQTEFENALKELRIPTGAGALDYTVAEGEAADEEDT